MPAASCRTYPARTRNLWLATSASAGASRNVGMNSCDQRCMGKGSIVAKIETRKGEHEVQEDKRMGSRSRFVTSRSCLHELRLRRSWSNRLGAPKIMQMNDTK